MGDGADDNREIEAREEIAVTGVLSLHREGALLRESFRSLLTSLRGLDGGGDTARGTPLTWELIAVLDRADEATERVLREEIAANCTVERCRILKVEVGDLGLSRNEAVKAARGRFIGFLDGDDLCSRDWFARAYELCSAASAESGSNLILHPEYNLYFGREAAIFAHPRQRDYDLRALFFHNLWSALSFGPREAYRAVPYLSNEISHGLGYEDWNWNCRTIEAGWVHEYVPRTAHFIRLKELSAALSEHSKKNACVIKPTTVWKRMRAAEDGGATRGPLAPLSERLERRFAASSAERLPLFGDDRPRIAASSLPEWLRQEAAECSGAEPLLAAEELHNFSPLTVNPFAPLLSPALLGMLEQGISSIHFVRSNLALAAPPGSLLIADEQASVGEHGECLSLSALAPELGSKLPLFIGMLAVQSGCREIHLWDSELGGQILATIQRALLRFQVRLVWHQLVPGTTPPDALMAGTKASRGWELLPHCSLVSYHNALPLAEDKLSVLYLVDIPREHRPWAQQCVWYRVIGPGKALESRGHRVMYLLLEDLPRWQSVIEQRGCDIVILHRGGASECFDRLRELTRQQRIPLCYDVDDNIVCGASLSGAGHLSYLSQARLAEIHRWADSNGESLRLCDAALLATNELESVASRLQPRTRTSNNYIPDFYLLDCPLFASRPRSAAAGSEAPIFVYYGPGSQEHLKFLETISNAIRSVMDAVPRVQLVLGGGLKLPAALEAVSDRVTIVPRVAPQFYLNCLRQMDLVLAPLDLDEFTLCKSWIKVLEAGYAGARWLGAPLPSYRRYRDIWDGGETVEDGDWERALRAAVDELAAGGERSSVAAGGQLASAHGEEYEAFLRAIIEESAADGAAGLSETILPHAAPVNVPHPMLQVYWSGVDEHLCEERSVRRQILRDRLESVELDLKVPPSIKLRVDPIDQRGVVAISELVIRCGVTGEIFFRADERGGWDRALPAGTCEILSRGRRLVLDCTGTDPQLNLPVIPVSSGELKIQILLRVDPPSAELRHSHAPALGQLRSSLRKVMSRVCFFLP